MATAVGDHPDLAVILDGCRSRGLDIAPSSLRIPAMREEILRPLADSGAKSVTIAPETGTDDLRRRLNKPISNERHPGGGRDRSEVRHRKPQDVLHHRSARRNRRGPGRHRTASRRCAEADGRARPGAREGRESPRWLQRPDTEALHAVFARSDALPEAKRAGG